MRITFKYSASKRKQLLRGILGSLKEKHVLLRNLKRRMDCCKCTSFYINLVKIFSVHCRSNIFFTLH